VLCSNHYLLIIKSYKEEKEKNRRLNDITGFSHPDYDFLCACL
jgi:hypothetical protein